MLWFRQFQRINNSSYQTKLKEQTSQENIKNFYFPGTSTFKSYVINNLIQNCDISVDDINKANIIYGPSIPNIQGQMTRRRPQAHDKIVKISLPPMAAQHHQKVSLSMDFFLSTA